MDARERLREPGGDRRSGGVGQEGEFVEAFLEVGVGDVGRFDADEDGGFERRVDQNLRGLERRAGAASGRSIYEESQRLPR